MKFYCGEGLKMLKVVFLFYVLFVSTSASASPDNLQKLILKHSEELLSDYEVSYVYGGFRLGSEKECEYCNTCLMAKKPKPKARFLECPECRKCSLDCSHFIQLVYERSGLKLPYLTTKTMLQLSKQELFKKYRLMDVGTDVKALQTGDLLVYDGHVVMLEILAKELGYGDIIHATSGREIREPGQGIQRKRMALLSNFRGPLLKVLRHRDLMQIKSLRRIQ